jgi:hypothetical protein
MSAAWDAMRASASASWCRSDAASLKASSRAASAAGGEGREVQVSAGTGRRGGADVKDCRWEVRGAGGR